MCFEWGVSGPFEGTKGAKDQDGLRSEPKQDIKRSRREKAEKNEFHDTSLKAPGAPLRKLIQS